MKRANAAEPPATSLVYVTGTYPLPTTTFIDREIGALRRQGYRVDVVAMRRPETDAALSSEQRALAQGVTYLTPVPWRAVARSHASWFARRPWRYLSTFAHLVTRRHPSPRARAMTAVHFAAGVTTASLVRRQGTHALHAHFADRAATISLVAARLLERPYTMSVHAGADIYVQPVLLAEKIRGAEHVVTCTEHNKVHLERLVGPELMRKVTAIPHGLDLEHYARTGEGADGDRGEASRPVVLAVGQLTERKGFAPLIDACAELRRRGVDLDCRIVGDGPQRSALQRRIDDHGLDGAVTLCGSLPHDEVVEEYRRATLFVLPCTERSDGDVDGIPNVLAEAMALEVPVVTSDLPAIGELVLHDDNGLLVPPGDVATLADSVQRLLQDPAARRALAARGRRTVVEVFDVHTNVARLASTLWPARPLEEASP